MTGREDFPWEEPYVFGGWDRREYRELKKTNPSHTDKFELLAIGEPDDDDDLIAEVKRVSDGKHFEIGLSWLKARTPDRAIRRALDDYATWHCNY